MLLGLHSSLRLPFRASGAPRRQTLEKKLFRTELFSSGKLFWQSFIFGKQTFVSQTFFWLTSTLVKKKIGWEFRSTNLFRFSLVNKSIWTSRTTEHENFRDDKAFEIEFLFLLVSCGETVIFPSLKKWCHDETFCLFKMHFFHHLVLFIQKGDCSIIKTTFPNPRNFWILLCMLFCRSILILVCLDTKMKD